MAAIAAMIRNLPAQKGTNSSPPDSGMNVLMMDAAANPSTNHGNIFTIHPVPGTTVVRPARRVQGQRHGDGHDHQRARQLDDYREVTRISLRNTSAARPTRCR